MNGPSALGAAQALVEYGSSTSSGAGAAAGPVGELLSSIPAELDRLVAVAFANPSLTALVLALLCVAAVVWSTNQR